MRTLQGTTCVAPPRAVPPRVAPPLPPFLILRRYRHQLLVLQRQCRASLVVRFLSLARACPAVSDVTSITGRPLEKTQRVCFSPARYGKSEAASFLNCKASMADIGREWQDLQAGLQ